MRLKKVARLVENKKECPTDLYILKLVHENYRLQQEEKRLKQNEVFLKQTLQETTKIHEREQIKKAKEARDTLAKYQALVNSTLEKNAELRAEVAELKYLLDSSNSL